jgi:allantoin racemase
MKLLILNPNSSPQVTTAIAEAALACLDPSGYEVQQIDEGPPVIEDEAAALLAADLVSERLRAQRASFDAFVVACHGDPGVTAAQQETGKPVTGIGAASFRAAAARGEYFGVITLGPELVEHKWRQVARCGLEARCAAIEPTHTGVLHGVGAQASDLTPYLEAGRRAIGLGADVLVLGCAGMVRVAEAVERELGVPVVEPVAAGIREAAVATSTT